MDIIPGKEHKKAEPTALEKLLPGEQRRNVDPENEKHGEGYSKKYTLKKLLTLPPDHVASPQTKEWFLAVYTVTVTATCLCV